MGFVMPLTEGTQQVLVMNVIPTGTCTTITVVSVPLPNSGRVGHTRNRGKRNNLAMQALTTATTAIVIVIVITDVATKS